MYIYICIDVYIYIYIYISIYTWHVDFGQPVNSVPACCLKVNGVMMRMGATDCLHDLTVYVLRSLLCACCVP